MIHDFLFYYHGSWCLYIIIYLILGDLCGGKVGELIATKGVLNTFQVIFVLILTDLPNKHIPDVF